MWGHAKRVIKQAKLCNQKVKLTCVCRLPLFSPLCSLYWVCYNHTSHCGWIELSWQWYAIYNTESKCNKLVKITKSVQTKKLTFTFKVQPEPQSLTLLLFRNITRNQPAGNELSRVTYWKKNYCRWVDCNVSVHTLDGSYMLTVTNLSYSDFPVGPQVFGNSDSHWRAFSIASQSSGCSIDVRHQK